MSSLKRARELSQDARQRMDSLLDRGTASIRDERVLAREEILRAIGELRATGRLFGDQGLLLEVIDNFLQKSGGGK